MLKRKQKRLKRRNRRQVHLIGSDSVSDPVDESGDTRVHAGVSRVGTTDSPRDHTDLIVDAIATIQDKRTARVALARVLAGRTRTNHACRVERRGTVGARALRVGVHVDGDLTQGARARTSGRCSSPSCHVNIIYQSKKLCFSKVRLRRTYPVTIEALPAKLEVDVPEAIKQTGPTVDVYVIGELSLTRAMSLTIVLLL